MMKGTLTILAVGLVCVVVRLPSVRVTVLNEDEPVYAAAAAAMAEGVPPYRAGVESKPPGIFYLYQAAFAVVGRYDLRALHGLTIVWVLATGFVLFALVARGSGRNAGLCAALFYFVFTAVQEPAVLATQCEIVYALPLVGAAWLLQRGRLPASLGAGVLCGLATLIKPTAASLVGAGLVWTVVQRRPLSGAALVAGLAATWLAAAAWFSHLGVWADLLEWTFRWTGRYVGAGFASPGFFERLVRAVGLWGLASLALLLAAARGARRGGPVVGLLALWAGAAFAMLLLGGRFYDQYFPALVTPLAGLAGIGVVGLSGRAARAMAAGIALPGLACLGLALRFDASMKLLGDERPPVEATARYVREHTRPTDRIFVWVASPALYVEANRLAATRFVVCNYLTGQAALGLGRGAAPEVEDRLGIPGGFDLLVAELEANQAELVVDATGLSARRFGRYPMARYPLLAAYVAAHYRVEAHVGEAVIYRRASDATLAR